VGEARSGHASFCWARPGRYPSTQGAAWQSAAGEVGIKVKCGQNRQPSTSLINLERRFKHDEGSGSVQGWQDRGQARLHQEGLCPQEGIRPRQDRWLVGHRLPEHRSGQVVSDGCSAMRWISAAALQLGTDGLRFRSWCSSLPFAFALANLFDVFLL